MTAILLTALLLFARVPAEAPRVPETTTETVVTQPAQPAQRTTTFEGAWGSRGDHLKVNEARQKARALGLDLWNVPLLITTERTQQVERILEKQNADGLAIFGSRTLIWTARVDDDLLLHELAHAFYGMPNHDEGWQLVHDTLRGRPWQTVTEDLTEQDEIVTATSSALETPPAELPFTGLRSSDLTVLGAMLLLTGGLILLTAARLRRPA